MAIETGVGVGLGATAAGDTVTKSLGTMLYYKLGGALITTTAASSLASIASGALIVVGMVALSKTRAEKEKSIGSKPERLMNKQIYLKEW